MHGWMYRLVRVRYDFENIKLEKEKEEKVKCKWEKEEERNEKKKWEKERNEKN